MDIIRKNKIKIIAFSLILVFGINFVLDILSFSENLDKIRYGQADYYIKKEQYEKAIIKINQILDDPYLTENSYSLRAICYFNLKKYDLALEDCEHAIYLNPSGYSPYLTKAHILNTQGKVEEALTNCDIAITCAPYFALTYATRAYFYYYNRNYYDALVDCDKSISLDPRESLAYAVRGLIQLQAGQVDKDESKKALENFTIALKFDDENAELYYDRALAYIQLEEKDKALEDLNKAVSLSNDQSILQSIDQQIIELNKSN